MTIQVDCRCGRKLSLPDTWAGKNGKCPGCGTVLTVPSAVEPVEMLTTAAPPGGKVATAFRNAFNALRLLLNPVSLPSQYDRMGPSPAMHAGIVLAILFDVCLLVALYRIGSRMLGISLSDLAQMGRMGGKSNAGFWAKMIIAGLIPAAGLTVAGLAVRKVFRGAGSIQADIFIAGASLLPAGCFLLLASLLGMGNAEVIAVLGTFAVCYSVLLPYIGCTRVSKVPETLAPAAVSIMLLLAAWVSKVIIVKLAMP